MNVYPVSSNPEYPIRIRFTLRLYIILIVERAHTRSRYSRPSKTEMLSHGTWCPDRLRRSTAHTPDDLLPDGLVSPRSLHGICESLSAVSERFSSRMPPQAVLVIPAVRGGAFRTAEHWLERTGACVPTTVSGAGEARQDITPFTKTLPLRSIKPPLSQSVLSSPTLNIFPFVPSQSVHRMVGRIRLLADGSGEATDVRSAPRIVGPL